MSDTLTSERARRAANSREQPDPFLYLLTLNHPSFDVPARVVRNTVDIVSRGMLFQALSYEPIWPADESGNVRPWQVRLDVIDGDIRRRVQTAADPITGYFEIIITDDPDIVELRTPDLVLRDINWDDFSLTGSLWLEDVTQQMLPGHTYNPAEYPGIF